MGKRSEFDRIERDFYETFDTKAGDILKPYVRGATYYEPCYGKGALVNQLSDTLTCVGYSDLETGKDALTLSKNDLNHADVIITNPPWTRKILHPMITHFMTLDRPVWLLFDAGWMFTAQARPYLPYCTHIITVGRMSWVPGTKMKSKDDCCWYRFNPANIKNRHYTIFINKGIL